MSEHFARRRYLINFESGRLGQVFTDVLIIGAGVAGLRASIEAAESADVLVITKSRIPECNTALAQGGVAAVTDPADSIAAHIRDTLHVGCELCDPAVVRVVAEGAPGAINELRTWGAAFDFEGDAVALGMEGGHSARRIIHAGDATGREVSRVLAGRARQAPRIRIFENCFVIDLVIDDGRCIGAITHHPQYGHQIIWARVTILATGGAGCVFRETTNDPSATGDGHAIAFRAGAVLRDMEFMQFHPTALYLAGASRALISEAVRGEGAYLVDREGRRFMQAYHADAELAPRDIVSRAIVDHLARTGATSVFIDVRHLPRGHFAARFPNIDALCRTFDIDVEKQLIPVRPAAHYMIGGVATTLDGESSIDGLLACGEAAASGLHGANRLASNSLAEGLVLGRRVGRKGRELAKSLKLPAPRALASSIDPSPRTELDLADVASSLRSLCWRNAGIDRNGDRLTETIEIVDFWGRYVMDKVLDNRAGWETQNMLTVARCIAQSALARKESRGVHYRSDFPQHDDARFRTHITLHRTSDGITEEVAAS